MLISHNGFDVTPFIVLDAATDKSWEFKLKEMFRFIRNIPEYNELLNKYLFDKGLSILVYMTSDDLPDYLMDLLDSVDTQNSNRQNSLGFCVYGVPVIVIDILTIEQEHAQCAPYMPAGMAYITIEEMVFDVFCHEITHIFQNQPMYAKNLETQYMERECEDFMYTVIFNNFDKFHNPYVSKDGYLYKLYKSKLKKYITDFEYPSASILTHPLAVDLLNSDKYDIYIDIYNKKIPLFKDVTGHRTKLGMVLMFTLFVIGNTENTMVSEMINNKKAFIYNMYYGGMDEVISVFSVVYEALEYSAKHRFIDDIIIELADNYEVSRPQIARLLEFACK